MEEFVIGELTTCLASNHDSIQAMSTADGLLLNANLLGSKDKTRESLLQSGLLHPRWAQCNEIEHLGTVACSAVCIERCNIGISSPHGGP